MKDVIWTIIGVWVIFRIIQAFRVVGQTNKNRGSVGENGFEKEKYGGDKIKNQSRKINFDKGGEYTDYEEIK